MIKRISIGVTMLSLASVAVAGAAGGLSGHRRLPVRGAPEVDGRHAW